MTTPDRPRRFDQIRRYLTRLTRLRHQLLPPAHITGMTLLRELLFIAHLLANAWTMDGTRENLVLWLVRSAYALWDRWTR